MEDNFADMPTAYTVPNLVNWYKSVCPASDLTERVVRSAIKEGSLKHVKVGSRILISTQAFLTWINGECDEV
ncbi:MAG: helix-turn-helix domain-containing protein [Eubacteriaceae bacterium]|nr:helix-turn-helix domain-containing protein [Eubacteriaceae bacterium]